MILQLKPQDIVILLKIIALGERKWTYLHLAKELSMSASEVHAGTNRAMLARLIDGKRKKPLKKALEEFLIHGVKYAFPAVRGAIMRGIPTSYAAPPLKDLIHQSKEAPPVWPDPEGQVRGYELPPLYKSAPRAALNDPQLYELLALTDAIRDGNAREKVIAIEELEKRLESA